MAGLQCSYNLADFGEKKSNFANLNQVLLVYELQYLKTISVSQKSEIRRRICCPKICDFELKISFGHYFFIFFPELSLCIDGFS